MNIENTRQHLISVRADKLHVYIVAVRRRHNSFFTNDKPQRGNGSLLSKAPSLLSSFGFEEFLWTINFCKGLFTGLQRHRTLRLLGQLPRVWRLVSGRVDDRL